MKLNHQKFDLEKITIVFFTDLHYGSKYHDKEMFLENRDWVLETPNVYVIEGGDLMETATRDSVGAGVFEQDEIVQKQMEDVFELYKPIADEGKLIGMHRGNHEFRLFKHAGVDLTKTLSKMLNTKYFGDGVIHYFNVGNQSYTLYTTHGHSGARLPHTKIKACIDFANMVDVEIYLMGHLHQLSHHTRMYYTVDKRSKTVIEAQKHFVIGGSYLNHWGSYAQMSGYEMMRKGSAKVKLSGIEKRIRISL